MSFPDCLTSHRDLGTLLSRHHPRRNHSPPFAWWMPDLERKIVVVGRVQIGATPPAEIFGGNRDRLFHHLRTIAGASEHHHLLGDDLGAVTLLTLLVLPLPGADLAFDVDLLALLQVLAADLGELAPGHDP